MRGSSAMKCGEIRRKSLENNETALANAGQMLYQINGKRRVRSNDKQG